MGRLHEKHPDWTLYFSTLTTTGYQVAREKFGAFASVFVVPLDFSWIVRRFFRRLRPRLFILAESEFWPNLLRIARRSSRAVLLVNGRVSAGSFRRYLRLRMLARRVLANIDRFLVQTDEDQHRLEAIGVPAPKVRVAGNLKAEIRLPAFSPADREALRRELGIPEGRKIIVAGSTHRGEEEIVLRAFRRASADGDESVLLLAPRHPERAEEVERAARGLGLRVTRRTTKDASPWQVLIIDTIGELAGLYAVADLAFVGGSLVPHGGQNLLEPAFYAKPIVFGPHMENFASLVEVFLRRDAARITPGEPELARAIGLAGTAELRDMGERAAAALASLQGATEQTFEEIERYMTDDQGAVGGTAN